LKFDLPTGRQECFRIGTFDLDFKLKTLNFKLILMKKDITRLFIALFLFLWVATVHGSVYAAFLKFDQASYDLEVGDTFDVQIIVNPGTEEVTSIDSYVKYGSSVINATGVTEGSYFPTVLNDLTSGKVYIAGLVDSPSDFKSGTGTVATITFEALKVGTTELVFDCDGQATVTSKVIKNDINSTNIIQCSQNGTATVTIGVAAASGSTLTPTPTGTSTENTSTPTTRPVTQLPASGSAENMMLLGAIGAVLVVIGGVAKLIRPF
jgi:hypothetical protein